MQTDPEHTRFSMESLVNSILNIVVELIVVQDDGLAVPCQKRKKERGTDLRKKVLLQLHLGKSITEEINMAVSLSKQGFLFTTC